MPFPYDEFDLSGVRTYPLASAIEQGQPRRLRHPVSQGGRPGESSRRAAEHAGRGRFPRRRSRHHRGQVVGGGVIWGFGAHVLKTGLSPILVDLAERGFVSAFATNGAGIIHDFEIALAGSTSEEVDEALGPGRFGMAEETGTLLNRAINSGVAAGLGIGQAVGRYLLESRAPHAGLSIAATSARLGIPLTAHVALGTDVIHMHPAASGSALGEGSLRDFRYFVSNVARLDHGVYLNCGSAVVLPEVFLKAVALARNRGIALTGLTTVNIDFMQTLPAADQRGDAPAGRHGRPGLQPRRPSRDPDPAARRRAY